MTERKHDPICSRPECDRPHRARGLCHLHYYRMRNGSQLDAPLPVKKTRSERFWEKTKTMPSGCIEWTGGTNGVGYGTFFLEWAGGLNKKVLAHRWAYENARGPIPEGLHLDHLCRNPICINPEHLEAVTQRENTLRGTGASANHAKKTECVNGHPLSGDNLMLRSNSRWRDCRECKRAKDRRYHHKKKAS